MFVTLQFTACINRFLAIKEAPHSYYKMIDCKNNDHVPVFTPDFLYFKGVYDYEVIVQVHVMNFNQFSSLPLFTWSGFSLGGPCQPQCPGPLARHLAEGQQGQANPKSAGRYRLPLQQPIPEELHLFKGERKSNTGASQVMSTLLPMMQCGYWTF